MVDQPFLDNKGPCPSQLQLRWCPACEPTETSLDALRVFVTWLQLGVFTILAEFRAAGLYFVFCI